MASITEGIAAAFFLLWAWCLSIMSHPWQQGGHDDVPKLQCYTRTPTIAWITKGRGDMTRPPSSNAVRGRPRLPELRKGGEHDDTSKLQCYTRMPTIAWITENGRTWGCPPSSNAVRGHAVLPELCKWGTLWHAPSFNAIQGHPLLPESRKGDMMISPKL